MLLKIYHNPHCSTSRKAKEMLESKNIDFEVVEYLKDVPTKKGLTDLIKILGIKAEELVRKKEAIYKERFADKEMTDASWIMAMIEFPKLIERPIVINGNKAVIGRPIEKIVTIL